MKNKVLIVKISEEQEKILQMKTRSAGFIKKSDYVRFVLFMSLNSQDMIKKIYDKVMSSD
jgi:hypothetical protein